MNSKTWLGLGLLLAGTAQAAELAATRVTPPATLLRGGNTVALAAQATVKAGDVVSVGPRGRVGLRFNAGTLVLSSLGDLQVYEVKPARGKVLATGKFTLLAGALRVDSRAIPGKPAQDVRLNIGTLKARVLGADAWAANTAEGDTLCVLAGSVSVQTEGTAEERLEAAGSCLRREPDGNLTRFPAAEDPVLAGAMAATSFDGLIPAAATVAVAVTAPDAVAVVEAPRPAPPAPTPAPAPAAKPAPIIATPPAAPAAAIPPPPEGSGGDWTVVVLSLSKAEPVAARAQELSGKGLPASARTATVNGLTMHRVTVGQFESQAAARAYVGTLAKSGIKGWPTRL